jgi:hypothetical protein
MPCGIFARWIRLEIVLGMTWELRAIARTDPPLSGAALGRLASFTFGQGLREVFAGTGSD